VAAGGTAGQVLTKSSAVNYDTGWQSTLPATILSPLTGPVVVGRETGVGASQAIAVGAGLQIASTTLSATARASGVFNYGFNSTAFVAPPANAVIRFNAASPYTSVTKVWADFDSSDSEDLYFGWMRITVGAYLMVQDKDNHNQYAEFTIVSPPVDMGTYVELTVTHLAHGSVALATQAVLVRITTPATAMGDILVTGTGVALDTGTKTAWAPLSGVSNTAVHWSGASDLTIQGISGGASGQRFTFKNTGAKWAWFTHASGAAAASARLTLLVSSSLVPVAPGGFLTLQHDGTNWKQLAHEQGALIESTFNAADFTASAGTWTLAAGDRIALQWKLSGTKLEVNWALNTTTTSTTPQQLRIGNGAWGGFTVKVAQALNGCVNNIPGLGLLFGFAQTGSSVGTTTAIWIFKSDASNFPAATDNLYTYGSLAFEVT